MSMALGKWRGRISAALVGGLLAGCSSAPPAPEMVAALPATSPPSVPLPPPGPALWRVSDGDTTVYLFGTVHALPEGAQWYDARIQRAFAASDELVTEIDMATSGTSASQLAQAAVLGGGRNLRQLMRPEDRAQYETALTALGVPVAALDPVEPWFAALNLTMLPLLQSGFNPDEGVDQVLTEHGAGKRHTALETVEEQVALFDGLPMDSQLALLDGAVEGAPDVVATLDAMVASWLKGDADGLAALMNSDMDDPALAARLLYDRNAHWSDWIEARLAQPGTVFMAVGAGHLAGTGSVQDLLGRRGLVVERIWQ